MARKKRNWQDFFNEDMYYEKGKRVATPSTPSALSTILSNFGSSSSPVSSSTTNTAGASSSFVAPKSEPLYTPYASQKVITSKQKEEVNDSYNYEWTEAKRKKEWNRVDQKVKAGEQVTAEEQAFYEGKADKIEQTPFKEDPNYYQNKNRETIKENTQKLKTWESDELFKDKKFEKISGHLTADQLKEALGLDDLIAADGDILAKTGVDTYDEWQMMVKNADNRPEHVAWKVDGDWVVMPSDYAEKVAKPGLTKAKWKLDVQGGKALSPFGDEDFTFGLTQAMQTADTLGSATRRGIHSLGTGRGWNTVGDVGKDIRDSLSGKYAKAIVKGDYENGPVYGRDILEDGIGWERDESKKWYNPQNLAHAGSGFLIDILAAPNISTGQTRAITNNGKQVKKNLSAKDKALAEEQILSRMPQPKNEAQTMMRDFIEQEVKKGNYDPSMTDAFNQTKNSMFKATDDEVARITKLNDEAYENKLFEYFQNQDRADILGEATREATAKSQAEQIVKGFDNSQETIENTVFNTLSKQDGKVRIPQKNYDKWDSNYQNGQRIDSTNTYAPFGGVDGVPSQKMTDVDAVLNNPSQQQVLRDSEWERMFANKDIEDWGTRRNANIEKGLKPENQQQYAMELQKALRGMTSKQTGLEIGIPFTRFSKEILSPKAYDKMMGGLNAIPRMATEPLNLLTGGALNKAVQKSSQQTGFIGNKVMPLFSRKWGVPQEVIRKINELTGDKSFAQNTKNREIINAFRKTSPEDRENLTQFLSKYYEKNGADAPKVDENLAKYYQDTMKEVANIESIPNTMEDYTWYTSALTKKDRDQLARNVKRAFDNGEVDSKTYNLFGNAGAKEFNYHTLSRQFKAPQELKNFIAQYGGKKMANKIDLDAGKALISRYDDSLEYLQNQRLNQFLTENNYIQGSDELGKNVYTDKTNDFTAKFIENAFKRRNSNDYSAFERGVRGINSWWKNGIMNTPILSLGTTSRNIQGGVINNMNEGVRLQDYLRAGRFGFDNAQYQMGQKMQSSRFNPIASLGEKLAESVGNRRYNFKNGETDFRTLSELMQKNQVDNGIYQAETREAYDFLDQHLGKKTVGQKANDTFQTLLNPFNTTKWLPFRVGQATTQGAENLVRRPLFFNRLDDMGISEDAARMAGRDVERTHFNYDASQSMSEFEDRVMRQVFPFYSFQRFNLPYSLESVLRNPSRLNRINYLEQELNNREDENRTNPFFEDYLKHSVALGDNMFLGANSNPRNDIKDYDEFGEKVVSSLNPFAKAGYNYFVGDSTGKNISGQDMTGNRSPLINQQFAGLLQQYANPVYDALGMKEVVSGDETKHLQDARMKQVVNDISPIISRLSNLGSAYDKSEEAGDKKLWNTMSGLSTYESDPAKQEGFAIDRTARDLEKRIQEIISNNEVSNKRDDTLTLEDNTAYNSNKLSDKDVEQSWATERKWFEEAKAMADMNYEPYFGNTSNGFKTAKDQFGNVIAYIRVNDKPETYAREAEMQQKVQRGRIQSQKDMERYNRYLTNGFPTIQDYKSVYMRNR